MAGADAELFIVVFHQEGRDPWGSSVTFATVEAARAFAVSMKGYVGDEDPEPTAFTYDSFMVARYVLAGEVPQP
jgi:hypothetical protein